MSGVVAAAPSGVYILAPPPLWEWHEEAAPLLLPMDWEPRTAALRRALEWTDACIASVEAGIEATTSNDVRLWYHFANQEWVEFKRTLLAVSHYLGVQL